MVYKSTGSHVPGEGDGDDDGDNNEICIDRNRVVCFCWPTPGFHLAHAGAMRVANVQKRRPREKLRAGLVTQSFGRAQICLYNSTTVQTRYQCRLYSPVRHFQA